MLKNIKYMKFIKTGLTRRLNRLTRDPIIIPGQLKIRVNLKTLHTSKNP